MQGKLSEIDIRSILQLIELGQRTGELFVEAYPSQTNGLGYAIDSGSSPLQSGRFWFVFFLNGQIVYAADTDPSLSRLRDYLHRYGVEAAIDSVTVPSIAALSAPEYSYLWALLENHTLTPAQGRGIIQGMVQETLFDLLSLHQGSFIFELSPALAPQLTTLEVAPLVTKGMKQVQEWKQLHPHIQSPEQCPSATNLEALREALSASTFETLQRYADGKTSLRQLARYLNREILTVARAIYPYVQKGMIQLSYPATGAEAGAGFKSGHGLRFDRGQVKTPRVVCIDDGVTIRETVESILSRHGYEATALGNPLKALSLVFQLQPDLILCDIAMPELDGYEICAMLRKSTAFRQIPIVMLTGKDGFIDRVRARMVGATDYLTKPFGENELLMLVEKYAGRGQIDRPSSERLLSRALEEGLETG